MSMNPEDIIKYKSLYLQTSWGYLNMLQKNVGFLLKDNQNAGSIDSCHLAAHSLKSQSVLMGFENIGKFSGLMEEIFKAAKEKTYSLNNSVLEIMLNGLKNVHLSLTQIAENGTEVTMTDVIAQLENVKKTG
jgi:chemotaxis protein histidine kinase CheA